MQSVDRNPGVVDVSSSRASGFFNRPIAWALCLMLLIGIGIVRIVATYHVFNHTIDEGAHVACGIEWLEKGQYRYETLHPPLARISVALGPYLAGVRGTGQPYMWGEATYILSSNGNYWHNLTLARMAVLPYFALLTTVVFLWARRLYGAPAGLLAAAVFTLLPTVLAHSAVATTDIAFTAFFCAALYRFTLLLEKPDWRNGVWFGVTAGLSLSTKLSTVVFLPACMGLILLLYLLSGRAERRALVKPALLAVVCAVLVVWSAYRFSHASLAEATALPQRAAAKVFGKSSWLTNGVQTTAAKIQVPAPEFFDGIRSVREQNREGRRNFLFGHVKRDGWWYFFLVALTLKTPLAVLLLAAFGAGTTLGPWWRDRSKWEEVAPLGAAIAILIVTAPSHINIGVRHVMPEFVFLSMFAGTALVALWRANRWRLLARCAAMLLCIWLVVSSIRAHPDYLAYFNELGGSDPSRLLVVSDFDWGQDLSRLATYLNEHQIPQVSVIYDGFFDPPALGFPATRLMHCGDQPSGWVAMEIRVARRYSECYPWFTQQTPVAIVGKTMWVFRMPEHSN